MLPALQSKVAIVDVDEPGASRDSEKAAQHSCCCAACQVRDYCPVTGADPGLTVTPAGEELAGPHSPLKLPI